MLKEERERAIAEIQAGNGSTHEKLLGIMCINQRVIIDQLDELIIYAKINVRSK